jgi:hypothetical protein
MAAVTHKVCGPEQQGIAKLDELRDSSATQRGKLSSVGSHDGQGYPCWGRRNSECLACEAQFVSNAAIIRGTGLFRMNCWQPFRNRTQLKDSARCQCDHQNLKRLVRFLTQREAPELSTT